MEAARRMNSADTSLESCLCRMSKKATPQSSCCLGRRADDFMIDDRVCPYPDEIIMSVLDRMLYYAGATRVIRQLGLAMRMRQAAAATTDTPPADTSPADTPPAALTAKGSQSSRLGKCSSSSGVSQFVSAKSNRSSECPSKPSSLKSRCTVVMPPCSPRQRTARVDFANPVCDNREIAGSVMSARMEQSLSYASIAYRRLKSKLASNFKLGQKWLWTRLVRSEGGYHVYEVYRNANPEHASHKKGDAKEPIVLFLVLPNGQVMPFESLSPIPK